MLKLNASLNVGLFRLFNAKYIFMQIVKNISISSYSVSSNSSNSKNSV